MYRIWWNNFLYLIGYGFVVRSVVVIVARCGGFVSGGSRAAATATFISFPRVYYDWSVVFYPNSYKRCTVHSIYDSTQSTYLISYPVNE